MGRNDLSPTSATGTGWERAPWHATQRAAWETLKKMSATNYTLGWMLRLALCALMLAGCGPERKVTNVGGGQAMMNKRRRKKVAAKQEAHSSAEMMEALSILGRLPHRSKRLPRLTWRERAVTDPVDPRGPKTR
jgi:hypothetical protein